MDKMQAVVLAEKEYPNSKAEVVADVGGLFYVNLQFKNSDGLAEFHSVDKKTGKVSGNIPTMLLMSDESFVAQLASRLNGNSEKKK